MKENDIKNILVIINVIFSFNFNLFSMYKTIDENNDTCNPDKAGTIKITINKNESLINTYSP